MRFRNTPKPFGNSLKGADAAGAGAGAAVVGAAAGMLPPGVDGTNNFQFTKMGTSAMVAGPLIGGIATAAGLGADLIIGAAQKRKDRKAIIDNGALLQDQMEAESVYAQEGGYNQDLVQFRRGGRVPAYANGGSNIIPNNSMERAGVQFRNAGAKLMQVGGQGGPMEDNQRMMTPNGPIAVSSGEGAANDDVLNKVARSMGIGFAEYQRSLYPDAEGGNIRQYAQGGPTEPYRAKNKADYDYRVQMYNDSLLLHRDGFKLNKRPEVDLAAYRLYKGNGNVHPDFETKGVWVDESRPFSHFAEYVAPKQRVLPPTPAVARTSVNRMDVRTPGMPEPQAGTPNSVPQPQMKEPSYSFQGGFRSPDALRFRVGPGNREVADGELSGMRAYARGGPGGPGGPPLREQSLMIPQVDYLQSLDRPDISASAVMSSSPEDREAMRERPMRTEYPSERAMMQSTDPTPVIPRSLMPSPLSPTLATADPNATSQALEKAVFGKLNDETKPNTNMNQEELWLNRLNRTSRNINLAGSAGSFVYNLLSKRTPGMAPRKLEHKPLDLDTNALKNMLANQTKSNMKTAQYNFRGRQNLGAELGVIAAGANQKMANAMQVEQVQNSQDQYNNAGENRVRQYNNDAFNQFAQGEVAANNQFRAMKGQMLSQNLSAMGQSYGGYVDGQIQLSQMGKQARLWDSYEAFRSGESNDVMSDDDYVYDIRGYRKRRRNERKAANA